MFEEIIKEIFMVCVYLLQVIGGKPGEFGHGYYLANQTIFYFTTSFDYSFFTLRMEKKKNKLKEMILVNII